MTITDLNDSYRIDVHINDKYDFDNYWKIKGMKENNIQYLKSKESIMHKYNSLNTTNKQQIFF